MATEWEARVLASLNRDQLVLYGEMHDRYSRMRVENARLRAENAEAASMIGRSTMLITELNEEVERLRNLAFGAGMALVGVDVASSSVADVLTAQDLIAQMLGEES